MVLAPLLFTYADIGASVFGEHSLDGPLWGAIGFAAPVVRRACIVGYVPISVFVFANLELGIAASVALYYVVGAH